MKRTILATVFAAVFAATAFAATPTSAPVLPSDLATVWEKAALGTCKKSDGTAIAVTEYESSTMFRVLTAVTKNGDLVALYDVSDTANTVKVRQADDSWLNYDRKVESPAGRAAVEKVMGMPPSEFLGCVDKN
ncbi:MAG: hypothetical protein A3D65_02120 [Candidatus Lloydbacteria bacterium RIFCSPHIGHO2_02_FULL_50_13]|uniref:Uncharacterized protein n=1 Tax=Candidatus Lloydbacteria bacterium RIFCSPHIGHO2_02_FULL_50_13 TaxID=1798661 RepID=A0A1G2CZA5_9BACT|nr:MAG: hypothetical protein A3D65_02120 [Candidatus Lloydbacteria bacterium RIFCSPHIGHO2_02_FULL_50_13]